MDKPYLFDLLNEQREFVIDPDTGSLTRRQAWAEIDRLLDCLNELNALEVIYE